jgi:hypothetical protein
MKVTQCGEEGQSVTFGEENGVVQTTRVYSIRQAPTRYPRNVRSYSRAMQGSRGLCYALYILSFRKMLPRTKGNMSLRQTETINLR